MGIHTILIAHSPCTPLLHSSRPHHELTWLLVVVYFRRKIMKFQPVLHAAYKGCVNMQGLPPKCHKCECVWVCMCVCALAAYSGAYQKLIYKIFMLIFWQPNIVIEEICIMHLWCELPCAVLHSMGIIYCFCIQLTKQYFTGYTMVTLSWLTSEYIAIFCVRIVSFN